MPKDEKNFITPGGLQRLREEKEYLLKKARPQIVQTVSWAASNGDRSENGDYIYGKKKLREIDRRIRFLTKRIESAYVIDPLETRSSKIVFGATVTVLDDKDQEYSYSIVGADEIDLESGNVSWKSPIAKALIGKEEGDIALLKAPSGIRELEIIKIEYTKIS